MALFLKNLLFTILAPGMVAGCIPLLLVPHGAMDFRLGTAGPGFLILGIGLAIYGWCLWDFAYHGRGTPAPVDPPKVLIHRGLYRLVRNPMYVGVLSVIAGWSLLYRSWNIAGYGVFVFCCFHSFVIFIEEPSLRRLFGDGYRDYCSRVRRWIPWPGPGK